MARYVALPVPDQVAAKLAAPGATLDNDEIADLVAATTAALNATDTTPPVAGTHLVTITQEHRAYVTQLDVYALDDATFAAASDIDDADLEEWLLERAAPVHSSMDIDSLTDTTSVQIDLHPTGAPSSDPATVSLDLLREHVGTSNAELIAAINDSDQLLADLRRTVAQMNEANVAAAKDAARAAQFAAVMTDLHPETVRRYHDGEI